MTPILDFFIFYLRSIPVFFSANISTNHSAPTALTNFTISIYQAPSGNITFGENVVFFCNLTQDVHGPTREMGEVLLEWNLQLASSGVIPLMPITSATSGKLDIIFNKTDPAEAISCRVTSGSITTETIHPLSFLKDEELANVKSDCGKKVINLPSPSDVNAAYIEGRSVVISWNPPAVPEDVSEVLEYVVEYKKTISHWTNGIEKVTLPVTQLSAHVKDLMPWTTYHFRVVAIYSTGQSAPSYPIVILTPEERPSGAPQNVTIRIKDEITLRIAWKPAPRNTWNGAILGYNIGSRKASSSIQESYTFHVLTAMELLGRPCVHEISVSDSSIPYKVVVQAFNNVGSGPLSSEATTESREPHQKNNDG